MRKSYPKARRFEPGFDLCGKAHAPVRVNRFDPLRLPEFDQTATAIEGTPREASVALMLWDAGYIDESMAGVSTSKLVEVGFANLIKRHKGDTPRLTDLSFGYSLSGNVDISTEKSSPSDWAYIIDCDRVESRLLEPRFQSIEDKAPGLFRTAVLVYDEVLRRFAPTGTPMQVACLAEMELWFGTSDQNEFLEEAECCGYEIDDLEEFVTPESFRKELPEWLQYNLRSTKQNRKTKPLSLRALRTLSKSADREIADLARICLQLKDCDNRMEDLRFPIETCSVYPLTLLRWNERDEMRHAYDDFLNRANESQDYYCSVLTESWVGIDQKSFMTWLRQFEACLDALKLANDLIELISVPDND